MVWNAVRASCRRLCRSELALLLLVVFIVWLASKRFVSKQPTPHREKHDVINQKFSDYLGEFDAQKTDNGWYDIGYRHINQVKTKKDDTWAFKFNNVALYSIKGRRASMEDRFSLILHEHKNYEIFGIFDGHGGAFVADYAEQNLMRNLALKLSAESANANVTKIMLEETVGLDEDLSRLPNNLKFTGSTAIFGYLKDQNLYLANLGDCRAIGIRTSDNSVHQLTIDHKPNQKDEMSRIKKSGGTVVWNGVWRVGGILAISRAFGDFHLKNPGWIIAEPDVFHVDVKQHGLDIILLASDGLWDVFTVDQVLDTLRPFYEKSSDNQNSMGFLLAGIKHLVEEAFKRGSNDNITVMVVKC